jgi:hypothetical protein
MDPNAAVCGLGFVVSYILVLAVSSNNPDDTSSDREIRSWYASHSHQVKELIVFFIGLAGALVFLWFLSHVRALIRQAERDGGRASTIALASGTAFVGLFAVMAALFAAPAFVLLDAGHKFALDPNTFRLESGLGAMAYMAAFISLAPLAFAVGVVAWRTRVLPRWLAVASYVAGVCALASPVWFPSWAVVLWIALLSGYLAVRGEAAAPRTTTAPAPA